MVLSSQDVGYTGARCHKAEAEPDPYQEKVGITELSSGQLMANLAFLKVTERLPFIFSAFPPLLLCGYPFPSGQRQILYQGLG